MPDSYLPVSVIYGLSTVEQIQEPVVSKLMSNTQQDL
jgi:hypothetical protein